MHSRHIFDKSIEDAHVRLRERGWCHIPSAGAQKFQALAMSLGAVVHETDVAVKPDNRGLVTSAEALDFHTDHSLVDYVAWLCIRPADKGGETILANAREALALLSSADQKILQTVMLKEHAVFENDQLQCPLVSNINGIPGFYYSFWLVDKNLPGEQRRAFDAFRQAVCKVPFDELTLLRDDVLVVNNSYILHGRRAIKDSRRQLKRVWIRSTSINPPTERKTPCKRKP